VLLNDRFQGVVRPFGTFEYDNTRPVFVTLQFSNHHEAWNAFHLLYNNIVLTPYIDIVTPHHSGDRKKTSEYKSWHLTWVKTKWYKHWFLRASKCQIKAKERARLKWDNDSK